MHEAVYWFGFFGAWLLFAGPVYQSALELREEEDARARMEAVLAGVGPPPPVSVWWWVLPPVALYLRFRRRARFRHVVENAMSDDDRKAVGHYLAVARGWMLVGAGAWCIFLKEAWELAEHREWSPAGYWVVVVALTLVATGGAGRGAERAEGRR